MSAAAVRLVYPHDVPVPENICMTPKQKALYDFIRQTWRDRGIAPSYQEMGDAIGVKSKGGISSMLTRMRERGLVAHQPRKTRTVQTMELPMEAHIIRDTIRRIALPGEDIPFTAQGHEAAVRLAREALRWCDQ